MGTLNQGHYYCYAKNVDDGNWYGFNDEKVLFVNKIKEAIVRPEAYILFY